MKTRQREADEAAASRRQQHEDHMAAVVAAATTPSRETGTKPRHPTGQQQGAEATPAHTAATETAQQDQDLKSMSYQQILSDYPSLMAARRHFLEQGRTLEEIDQNLPVNDAMLSIILQSHENSTQLLKTQINALDQQKAEFSQAQKANEEKLQQMTEQLSLHAEALQLAMAKVESKPNAPATPDGPASPARTGGKAKKLDIPRLLPPTEISLAEFRTWKKKYLGFARLQRLDEDSVEERRDMLCLAIADEWNKLCDTGVITIEDGDDQEDFINKLGDYLRTLRNPLLDRRAFGSRNQRSNESIDQYVSDLQVLYDNCDYIDLVTCQACDEECGHSNTLREERLRDRFVCGLTNPAMQADVFKIDIHELTFAEAVAICKAIEGSTNVTDGLGKSASVHNVKSSYKKNKTKQRQQGNSSTQPPAKSNSQPQGSRKSNDRSSSAPSKSKGSCTYCGGTCSSRAQCPAREHKCKICSKSGHYPSVCFSKQKGQQQVNGIHVSRVESSHLPVKMHISTSIDKKTLNVPFILDSGTGLSVLALKDLRKFKADLKSIRQTDIKLNGPDNSELNCLGTVPVTLTHGEHQYPMKAYVIRGAPTSLLSLEGIRSLDLLPMLYPEGRSNIGALSIGQKSPSNVSIRLGKRQQSKAPSDLAEQFFNEFDTVFPTKEDLDMNLPAMNGPPAKIEIEEGAVLEKRYKPNSVPYALQDKVRDELKRMCQQGVIEPVPPGELAPCVSPMVHVLKPNGDIRICVDYSKLNKHVLRRGYAQKTPAVEVASIPPGQKYFSCFDSVSGYHQVELDPASKPYTTFITPEGRFQYCRQPQGLKTSSEIHDSYSDAAFTGIPGMKKIVEDIILYDETLESHLQKIRLVLQRCKEHGITLSRRKAKFALPSADWCGYHITSDGYTVSEHLVTALTRFPRPQSRTDVRSFAGLCQQFEALSPRLTELLAPLRPLLSPKAEFTWSDLHEKAFRNTIQELSSPRILAQFDPKAKLRLETDASKLNGLGYALFQQSANGTWRLLRCGSRTLTPTESRYSVTESELLAIVYAVRKLRMYLYGRAFQIITDHKALVSILNGKSLDEINSPRILRLKHKLIEYVFTVEWRPGSKHTVVDVFSRHPVDAPDPDDIQMDAEINDFMHQHLVGAIHRSDQRDLQLEEVATAAERDPVYGKLRSTIIAGFPDHRQQLDHDLHTFWSVRNDLSLYKDLIVFGRNRLLIPQDLRPKILRELHAAHPGLQRALARARTCLYWPQMTKHITDSIQSCQECTLFAKSNAKETLLQDQPPERPGQAICIDLFSYEGQDYLVCVDRYSGWLDLTAFHKSGISSRDVIKSVINWCVSLGIPQRLTSDGGPNVASAEFDRFCSDWGIIHEKSSPHFAQANGTAEAAVKSVKALVKRTPRNQHFDENLQKAILEHRNTPKRDGLSPAQRVFGRPMRTHLPLTPMALKPIFQNAIRRADKKALELRAEAKRRYDIHARDLDPLHVGDIVRIQHQTSKK